MKLFKTVDDKFKEIGFVKIRENRFGATYDRRVPKHKFTQRLVLLHKACGRHIVQSYDVALADQKGIGHTCVGLTMYELELCIKKMRQMGWKVKKPRKE